MRRFQVRYKVGQAPAEANEDDVVVVEAAMFTTLGKYVAFYSHAAKNVDGGLNAKGGVVYRVHEEFLLDVKELSSS